MANTLENTGRTWPWMDQYEEAQVNQYSFNVLLLVQLYRTANVSAVAAPPANSQLEESVGTKLDCNNTVLDLQAQVRTQSRHSKCCINVQNN